MTAYMEKLVELAKQGNHQAMQRLYEMNKEKIFNLAMRYSRNREDAQEILQDTFVRAFNALKNNRLQNNGRFPAWLYRIGINSSIDQIKRTKKYKSENFNGTFVHKIDRGHPPDPEQEVLRQELGQKIRLGLLQLSDKQRLVFTLKHFQHLKIREIAEHLHCTEGSVKKQLFRAIQSLRKVLGPLLGEES